MHPTPYSCLVQIGYTTHQCFSYHASISFKMKPFMPERRPNGMRGSAPVTPNPNPPYIRFSCDKANSSFGILYYNTLRSCNERISLYRISKFHIGDSIHQGFQVSILHLKRNRCQCTDVQKLPPLSAYETWVNSLCILLQNLG